jgi:amidase
MTTGLPREATELADLIRRRQLSARDLARHSLDVIRARDGEVGAFVDVAAERAMRAAARADAIARRGGAVPALLGVPTGIKDHDHLRWHFTRVGSRALTWLWSPVDGVVARSCRRAGMVMLGKLATSELTILPFVDTAIGPPTRNPHATDRYAGGSSGGSAAAVAAGMIAIAPGSDGGGSIRIPASFCGLVGFKTGRGVLPGAYARIDIAGLSANGPLARSVRDAALMLDVMSGRGEHRDPPAPESYVAAARTPPRAGLRVRVIRKSPLVAVDPEIDAAVTRVARQLVDLGHAVDEGTPLVGELEEFIPLMARMVASAPFPGVLERRLQPSTRWLRERGRAVSRAQAADAGRALAARVLDWFGDADLIVSPTVAQPPPAVGAYAGLDGEATFRAAATIGAFTAPFNVSGQPAISLPVGATSAGTPIGVQLVGRPDGDRALLGIAASLERALA